MSKYYIWQMGTSAQDNVLAYSVHRQLYDELFVAVQEGVDGQPYQKRR